MAKMGESSTERSTWAFCQVSESAMAAKMLPSILKKLHKKAPFVDR